MNLEELILSVMKKYNCKEVKVFMDEDRLWGVVPIKEESEVNK